jgi:hypothetical protein
VKTKGIIGGAAILLSLALATAAGAKPAGSETITSVLSFPCFPSRRLCIGGWAPDPADRDWDASH